MAQIRVKPFTRVRRGKLEHVKGFSRESPLIRATIWQVAKDYGVSKEEAWRILKDRIKKYKTQLKECPKCQGTGKCEKCTLVKEKLENWGISVDLKKPGEYTVNELTEKLKIRLTKPASKYKDFYIKDKPGIAINKYRSLNDRDKLECLIHGIARYQPRYIEKVKAGKLWNNPKFMMINREIGKNEGIRRAFIEKAISITDPKVRRQFLFAAMGYQTKVNKLIEMIKNKKLKQIFEKKLEKSNIEKSIVNIYTLDELFYERGGGYGF